MTRTVAGRARSRLHLLLVVLAALVASVPVAALEPCSYVVGEVTSIEGTLEVQREADRAWAALAVGDPLCRADTVRTGTLSRAALGLRNEAVLRLDAETTLTLAEVAAEPTGRSLLGLALGALQSFSRKPREVDVQAPHMVLAVRGTEFTVRAELERSILAVQEGTVVASNDHGELAVQSGQSALARAGEAPQPYLLITPADAVQWALHYPAVLTLDSDLAAMAPAEAIATIDARPGAADDPALQVQRAALLLSVGRIDQARTAIDRALAVEPQSGAAYALRAVIDVAQNRVPEAQANAARAVELAPERASSYLARSYAEQAAFDIRAARDALVTASEREPGNALVLARLAEVELMLGDPRLARQTAERARALDPRLARTESVLGFSDLAAFRFRSAQAAFQRAIELDPSDPLARFGLGLSEIRRGDLAGGRGNIEAAVGLDPSNALLRTYLGKAYFEEKRDELAGEQFEIAKGIDPLDPTPWLYDAIRKQTMNRPVEALRDLERSIALNDNRAVYRSRQLLDQDRAARGTSLARIYNDLGFIQRGITEAGNSLSLDPGNSGAHRFLSDVYRDTRRRELARVSELLQSQLLQDINITPIQPSLSEANLNIVTQGGPADTGFNEFTPLFERNQVQVTGSGVVGNNDTLGGEAVASALYDRFSLSAGAFGFATDGWRDNNDIDHNIYNVYFQTAITEQLNLQLEYRRRETEYGDLDFDFDPDAFSDNEHNELDQDIARVALRYSPTANSDLILSYIYSDREATRTETENTDDGPLNIYDRGRDDGHQVDLQHILRRERFNVITGGGFTRLDGDQTLQLDLFGVDESFNDETRHHRGYVYGNINIPDPVIWTVGLSYDDFEYEQLTQEKVNPKLGVQWQALDSLTLRAAAFRVMKPPLTSNQTLEPTQVAGFNQFFDDANGDVSTRYGLGFDWRAMPKLTIGGEATWRDLDQIAFGEEGDVTYNADEQTHRLYANWTPTDQTAITAELVYDRWEAQQSPITAFSATPEDLETWSLPITARYFHPSGFFAVLGGTFVHQDVKRAGNNILGLEDGSDSFFLVNAAVGYRFPKRIGAVSLQANNIFDTGFHYQDDSFREVQDQPSVGPYIPERQVMLRLTLTW
jgi:tetratricopeptide (TPR) repeat protein